MGKRTRPRSGAECEADKARTGRPPKAKSERQSERIMVHLTPAEKKRFEREAKEAGLSLCYYSCYWDERCLPPLRSLKDTFIEAVRIRMENTKAGLWISMASRDSSGGQKAARKPRRWPKVSRLSIARSVLDIAQQHPMLPSTRQIPTIR